MRITPALAYEKLRQDAESQNKIILHKDGKFYHVYEWSAWLLKTLVCTEELQRERGDAKMLQVNRFVTKSGEYVLAGFPLESVSKYIPEYDDIQEMEGGDLSITITLSDDMQQLSTEQLQTMFEEWKQDQPIKEGRKSTREIHAGSSQAPTLARSGVFAIISEVLSYPVEQKTPAENIEFISKMKQSIVALL
jgi:hypothetical protein